MQTADVMRLTDEYLMQTYRRAPVAFASGDGMWLTDLEGKRYLDFVAGIAVDVLGHSHPVLVGAIQAQAGRLLHVSNLYQIPEQTLVAQWLVEHSVCDRAFFCNSGTEAIEAAIKLARKFGRQQGGGKFEIIIADHSFHGRTLGALAATAQPKYQQGFEPLPGGFTTVPLNNLDALRAAITPTTCAVMLEPIQGEGGINPASPGYLHAVRHLCNERGLLLIVDEIQTGMGRTGKLFAYEHFGIAPDMIVLAKGLGGGVPIGALLATERVATAFVPGDHGSTFGGNPLACAAAFAVVSTIETDGLVAHAAEVGRYLVERLQSLAHKHPIITEVRGLGLMQAVELNTDAKPVVDAARDRGLLINAVKPTTLRLVPPLIVTMADVDEAIRILDAVFMSVAQPVVGTRT